jgi:hypothetical protein
MNFKLWLEKLELIQQEPVPDDYWTRADGIYARIWGNQHKNPQWLKSHQKENTISTYTMPIEEESFIHFAPNETIEQIIKDQHLKRKSNYAVSTTFGFWFPQVQYSHISRMIPYTIEPKNVKKLKRPIPPRFKILDYGNEISAIRFKTNTIPSSATPEEVWWDKPVELYDTEILSSREAINILKHTPEYKNMSPGRNIVKYV